VNNRLMASCVGNIHTKNYQNLVIGFKVTVTNVGDVFETQCRCICRKFGRWTKFNILYTAVL